jgi:hypothetical protein
MELKSMINRDQKNLIIIVISAALIFCWLWTEWFGIFPRYQYGSSIEKALSFWHSRGLSNIGLANIISTADTGNDDKLI